jgi:hypothetical protein
MLKRPLDPQFGPKVLAGIKRTTIRTKPWPIGVPIMLYHWTGVAYRSPQRDVAAVIVSLAAPISITHRPAGDLVYEVEAPAWNKLSLDVGTSLWKLEGFDSQDAMDTWFRPLVRPGQTVHKHLMRFELLKPET